MNQEPFNSPATYGPPSRWYKPWSWALPRWMSGLLAVCMVILTVATIYELYRRATNYGGQVVEKKSELIPVGIALKNTRPWLSADILSLIRKETEDFARQDDATFRRFQNPTDNAILQEIADRYTARDLGGVDRQAVNYNAWVKRITQVRRYVQPDRQAQWIEIYAEYRRPAAVIAVPIDRATGKRLTDFQLIKDPARVPAMRYYLVDEELTRLPGEYSENVFASMQMMTLYGVDQDVPAPGSPWTAPELAAGLKLAGILAGQPFASQIALINLANFEGRAIDPKAVDKTDAHITLLTPYGTEVRWGRAIGEEKFYEIAAGGKIKALTSIFARFNRIDAGRNYVDIRYGQIKVPTTIKTASDAGSTAPPTTRPHHG